MIDLKTIETPLFEAVTETFENMAFMEVAKTNSIITKSDQEKYVCAKLPFNGNFQGEAYIYITADLIGQVAESLYNIGCSAADSSLLHDLHGEILNTFLGTFLSKTVPEGKTYSMGIPEVVSNRFIGDIGPSSTIHFEVDESLIGIELIEAS